MEVFSLLKYWRTGGGVGETHLTGHSINNTTTTTTNISTNTGYGTGSTTSSVSASTITTIREDGGDCGEESDRDDGPFFDLEFTLPVQEEQEEECEEENEEGEGSEEEDEFDFTVNSSCSTGNRTDPNLLLSPSDDLFFNGRFVPLEPAEFGFSSTEPSSKLQFPGALLKPATKLRVLMLGLKKPKSAEKTEVKQSRPKASFMVKLKVEEDPVTILSLFSRDNSSRTTTTTNTNNNKMSREDVVGIDEQKITSKDAAVVGSDERKFTKDVLQKYLKMVKPLYFKVSKKSNGLSAQLNVSSAVPVSISSNEGEAKEPTNSSNVKGLKEGTNSTNSSNVKVLKEGNLTAGLRNVRKHLGKSRSASSAVASVPAAPVQSRRHDDSLLQQQDGIQSAIMHCKRSFTASRDSDSNSSSLFRCTSDPSHEKSKSKSTSKPANPSRNSLDETRPK